MHEINARQLFSNEILALVLSVFFMETFVFICYCVFAKNHFNGWWAKFLFLLVSDFVSYECIGTEKNYR